jgi:hypothetical protein
VRAHLSTRPALAGGLRAAGAPAAALAVPLAAAVWLALHDGGYTVDEWGPWAALTLVVLALALARGETAPVPRAALALPGALAALAAWALASIAWAPYRQGALVDADRYLYYAAVCALCLVCLTRPALRRAAITAVAAAAAVIAVVLVARLLAEEDPASLFQDGRLAGTIAYPGGTAAAVAIGFWPLVALASLRGAPALARIAAGAGGGLVLAVIIATQARASLWSLVLSTLAFAVLCPTPLRSAALVAAPALAVGLLWDDLNAAYRVGAADVAAVRTVGWAALAVAAAGALAAGAVVVGEGRIRPGARARRALVAGAAVLAAAALAGAAAGAVAATDGHPVRWAERQWDAFTTRQAAPPVGTRFFSLATDRYDLWRVAVLGLEREPFTGHGGGSFSQLYQEERRSGQQAHQAHGEPLEVAATLGVPGLVVYVVALALPLAAALRLRRAAGRDDERRADALRAAALGGALAYFAVHSSVDWIWHLAAAALPFLVLASVAVGSLPARRPDERRPARWPLAAAGLAIVAALMLVVPASIAQRELYRSYGAPTPDALAAADRARTFDRFSSRPDLARARALLAAGRVDDALAAARAGADREPDYWVAWQLVLVAAERSGDTAGASEAEAEVERLNPNILRWQVGQIPNTAYDHY